MKKITFLFVLLIASLGFSQELVTNGDFESGVSPWAGNNDSNGAGYNINIVDDGSGNMVNSALIDSSSDTWRVNLQQVLSLTQNQAYELSFDAYVDSGTATMIAGIAENFGGFAGAPTVTPAMTTTSQTFVYTITFEAATTTNGRVFFDMGGAANNGKIIYIDNVSLVESVDLCNDGILNNGETEIDCGGPNCIACPSPPTVAAPTPPARAAANVVSIYSGAYASIPAIDYDAGFCGTGATTEITAGGDAVFAFNSQNCQGIDFSANTQDITGYTNLHVDLFIEAGTDLVGKVFNITVVGPDGAGQDTVVAIDINALSPAPVPGTWYSYDVATSFNATTIRQITVTSNLNNDVWYDNLYLHNDMVLSTDDFSRTAFRTYPNPTQDNWTIETQNVRISSITLFDVLGKSVISIEPKADRAVVDGSNLKSGLYFAKIETAEGSSSIKLIKN